MNLNWNKAGFLPLSISVLKNELYDTIFPLNREVLRRWCDILVYALFAVPVAGILFQTASDLEWYTGDDLFSFGDIWLVSIFCAALITWLHWVSGFRVRQTLLYVKYPGIPVAAFCALLFHALCVRWSTIAAQKNERLLWILTFGYGAFIALFVAVGFILELLKRIKCAKRMPFIGSKKPLAQFSPDELLSWVENSNEIQDCSNDYFDFIPRGEKILTTLSKKKSQCVAIVGPYGSGKTSLVKILSAEAERRQYLGTPCSEARLLFHWVSCWGFEKNDSTAEAILRQIVEQLRSYVDCLAVSGLPKRYASSLSKVNNYVETFLNLAHANDPTEQLKGLSPILRAIGVRLVIVLEDADRNGEDFDVHQIEGLLIRLKSITDITFIICAGRDCKLDFVRLAEHVETLPAIEGKTAIEIIGKIREKFCNEKGIVVLAERGLTDDPTDYNKQFENALLERQGYHLHDKWNYQLAVLLDTPRALKSGVRRFIRAWESLKGEVNIDQLLVASALRERSPRHFSFVQRHWNDFGWLGEEMEKTVKPNPVAESLRKEWDELIDWGADKLATRKLMAGIFPEVHKLLGTKIISTLRCCQSVFGQHRGYIYRDRIFNEYITPGPMLDQPMLRLIAEANENDEALVNLAIKMTTDEAHFEHFEFLSVHALSVNRVFPLLSVVFTRLRQHDGRKAKLDQIHLGAWASKAIINTRGNRSDVFVWAEKQVMECLPTNLTLAANIIEYMMPSQLASREVARTRGLVCHELEKHFARASTQRLSEAIDDESPDTLKWLIHGVIDASKWVGPLFSREIREKPTEIIPQILELTGEVTQTTYGDGRQEYSYKFNKELVVKYFGKYEADIFDEIEKFNPKSGKWQLRNGPVSATEVNQAAAGMRNEL